MATNTAVALNAYFPTVPQVPTPVDYSAQVIRKLVQSAGIDRYAEIVVSMPTCPDDVLSRIIIRVMASGSEARAYRVLKAVQAHPNLDPGDVPVVEFALSILPAPEEIEGQERMQKLAPKRKPQKRPHLRIVPSPPVAPVARDRVLLVM